MNKVFLLFVGVLISQSTLSFGQAIKDFSFNPIPPDPEAASLCRYGDYNFNLSEGKVDISVPIATLHGRTLEYPTGISYDHSGIKVDERATCAGMNWSFTGVGLISRTVVGGPDEDLSLGYSVLYPHVATLTSSFPPAFYLTSANAPYNTLFDPSNSSTPDLQPDIYSYTFMGRSGKFFRDPSNGEYYTMPYSKLKIQTTTGNSIGPFFTITDEKGYVFKFNLVTATDVQSNCTNDASSWANYPGQWYLTEVDAPDGNIEFSLTYTDNSYPDITTKSTTATYLVNRTNLDAGSCSSCPGSQGYTVYPQLGNQVCLTTVSYNGKLLSSVSGPTQNLFVNYASRTDGSYRISDIQLKLKDNSLVQKWIFYHDYYNATATNTDQKLRLDSIGLFSNIGRESSYVFDYTSNTVPIPLSTCQDYWGFNNGVTNNANLIPKIFYINQWVGTANRNSDFSQTKVGILNKIHYPTGGTTEFEYELNDYGKVGENVPSAYAGNVSDPIWQTTGVQLVNHNYIQTDNSLPTFVSKVFTLSTATLVHVFTKRDKTDNVPCPTHSCAINTTCIGGHCNNSSNDPCTVQIKLTSPVLPAANNYEMSLNGSVATNHYEDILLQPGTYTLSIDAPDDYNWGQATLTYDTVSGYLKNKVSGGLRIKKITNYDQYSSVSNVRSFSYRDLSDPTRSSGIASSEPGNFISHNETGTDCFNCSSPGCCIGGPRMWGPDYFESHIVVSQGNNEVTFCNGQPVVYSRVVETVGANGEGGSIEHLFSFYSDKHNQTFPFPGPSPRFWRRGLPVQTNRYDRLGNLVESETNAYAYESSNYHRIKGVKVGYSKAVVAATYMTQVTTMDMDYTSEWMHLSQTTKTTYPTSGSPISVQTNYFYDNPAHIESTRVTTTQSDGAITTVYTRYPDDYNPPSGSTDPAVSAMYAMLQKNMRTYPIEEVKTITRSGSESIVGAALNTYKQFGPGISSQGQISLWQQYKLKISTPPSYITAAPLSSIVSGALTLNTNYEKKVELGPYSSYNNVLTATGIGNRTAGYIWINSGTSLAAQADNATNDQIAYSGFETPEMGNWLYSSSAATTAAAFTGQKSCDLTQGGVVNSSLPTGNYIVSYWSNGSNALVNGAGPTVTGSTHQGWTYYEHSLSNVSSIAVTGSAKIDELRLYPMAAQMKTFTYLPGIGISAECDISNHVRFYEYGTMGRLQLIRDEDGNIIKKFDYLLQQGE